MILFRLTTRDIGLTRNDVSKGCGLDDVLGRSVFPMAGHHVASITRLTEEGGTSEGCWHS
jgi:hypothetical protein